MSGGKDGQTLLHSIVPVLTSKTAVNWHFKVKDIECNVGLTITPISDHAQLKIFWSTFNLCEFVSKCKKSGYFIDLFWRYGWLKNPAIWLAENILAHISGANTFPKALVLFLGIKLK